MSFTISDLDTTSSMSQDVLLEVIESLAGEINTTLRQCCNASLVSVERSVLEPLVTQGPATGTVVDVTDASKGTAYLSKYTCI